MKLYTIRYEDGPVLHFVETNPVKAQDKADAYLWRNVLDYGKNGDLPEVEGMDVQDSPYDTITYSYFGDHQLDFDNVDINDHPLLKIVALLLDDAITTANAQQDDLNSLIWNALEFEINTLSDIQTSLGGLRG